VPPATPPLGELQSALRAFELAYRRAEDLITAMPEPQRAFESATALREATDSLVGRAAELRARMAGRIWEAEQMSLAVLADRIGVSKSRADQLLRIAKANPAEPRET
jgi:hypothetical protein